MTTRRLGGQKQQHGRGVESRKPDRTASCSWKRKFERVQRGLHESRKMAGRWIMVYGVGARLQVVPEADMCRCSYWSAVSSTSTGCARRKGEHTRHGTRERNRSSAGAGWGWGWIMERMLGFAKAERARTPDEDPVSAAEDEVYRDPEGAKGNVKASRLAIAIQCIALHLLQCCHSVRVSCEK